MQDLRGKLKKAGLVSKKQARSAKTEARKAKKQSEAKGPAPLEPDNALPSSLQRKRQEIQQHQQRLNDERARHEQRAQIKDLIRTHQIEDYRGGDQSFHYVAQDQRIRKIIITRKAAQELSRGRAAIVEQDIDPPYDYALVSQQCAERLSTLAPQKILFWNKPGSNAEEPPTGDPGR